jgi:hypothetical protein
MLGFAAKSEKKSHELNGRYSELTKAGPHIALAVVIRILGTRNHFHRAVIESGGLLSRKIQV